jgi:aminoglycoside 6'-N-acetyltransferase
VELEDAPWLMSQTMSPVWRSLMFSRVLSRIAGLLEQARGASAKGSIGWPHHTAVQPRSREAIIRKRHSSAFHDTDFDSCLTEAGINRLIVLGIQTEMCVDSTCRAAVSLGDKITLVSDAHTTFHSPVLPAEKIIAHHNRTLVDGFVDLVSASDVVLRG